MENQEVLKAIAVLADKVSRYHERLLASERDNLRLQKTLSEHLKGCGCHDTSSEKIIKPKEKMLLIFPSEVFHFTSQNNTEIERVSISGNFDRKKVG